MPLFFLKEKKKKKRKRKRNIHEAKVRHRSLTQENTSSITQLSRHLQHQYR